MHYFYLLLLKVKYVCSSSEHDSHNPVLVNQTNEFELVVKDIQEVKKTVKEVLEGFKDLKEQMRLKLSS